MSTILAQNGIGGEVIVWLIIAFFWVVAQLFSRTKERGQGRQRSPNRKPETEEEARTLEKEMRQFFEELGADPPAVQEVQPPPVTQRQAPPPMPEAERSTRRSRDARRRMRFDRTEEQRRPVELPRAPVSDDVRLGAIDTTLDESALNTELAYALPDHRRDESVNAFVNPRTLLVNLNYLRMNMPIIPISGLSTTGENRPRPQLKGRAALRDAITAQLILSNPLAMGEDKGSYTKRIV